MRILSPIVMQRRDVCLQLRRKRRWKTASVHNALVSQELLHLLAPFSGRNENPPSPLNEGNPFTDHGNNNKLLQVLLVAPAAWELPLRAIYESAITADFCICLPKTRARDKQTQQSGQILTFRLVWGVRNRDSDRENSLAYLDLLQGSIDDGGIPPHLYFHTMKILPLQQFTANKSRFYVE